MRQRVVEHIKSAAIVLLLCSAVFLAFAANFPQVLRQLEDSLHTSGSAVPPGVEQGDFTAAAIPVAISLRSEVNRQTISRDFELLESTYEAFAGYLGEALATAGPPQRLTGNAFSALTQQQGIYFCYAGAIPLDALAQWLQSEYSDATQTASWFFLSVEAQRTVTLYFGNSAGTYRCATQLVSSALAEQIASVQSDGSYFAGETDSLRRISPRTLLLADGSNRAAAASVSSAATAEVCTQIASLLKFNPYGDSAYQAPDGTQVYTESLCSLRIAPDGKLSLVNQDPNRYAASGRSSAELISTAYTMLQSLTQLYSSDARLYLTGVYHKDSQTILHFDYLLDGLVIAQQQGHGASVTFVDGAVSTVVFWLRSYTRQEAELTALPAPQAAALLEAGAVLQLEYADLGSGSLQLGWKKD